VKSAQQKGDAKEQLVEGAARRHALPFASSTVHCRRPGSLSRDPHSQHTVLSSLAWTTVADSSPNNKQARAADQGLNRAMARFSARKFKAAAHSRPRKLRIAQLPSATSGRVTSPPDFRSTVWAFALSCAPHPAWGGCSAAAICSMRTADTQYRYQQRADSASSAGST
jgi:hypothetical protein